MRKLQSITPSGVWRAQVRPMALRAVGRLLICGDAVQERSARAAHLYRTDHLLLCRMPIGLRRKPRARRVMSCGRSVGLRDAPVPAGSAAWDVVRGKSTAAQAVLL